MSLSFVSNYRFRKYFAALLIFIVSLSVGALAWQDLHTESLRVQSGVYAVYQATADCLRAEGLGSLFDSQSCAANVDFVSHPPGYPLLIAFLYNFTDQPKNLLQFISLLSVAGSALLIFLIIKRLLSFRTALIAGLLAAFSPQLTASALPLLPDSLSVFPLLLALFFFVRAYQRPDLLMIVLSGICLGASCWLRSNYLLMPVFFVPAIFLLFNRQTFYRYSLALIVSFVLTIALVTIRNALAYREFIPLSIGAGQTLLEGIGDYDPETKLGAPATDIEISRLEAEKFNRPDYAKTLFGPDGIKRDRSRLAEGWQIIKENPLWFMSVMARRAASMLRLERAPIISTEIPVVETSLSQKSSLPLLSLPGEEITKRGSLISPNAKLQINQTTQTLILHTDQTKYDAQYAVEFPATRKNQAYLIRSHLKIPSGRISLKVTGTNSGKIYFSRVLAQEDFTGLPSDEIQDLTFVPARDESVRLLISNEVSGKPSSTVEISSLEFYELGAASSAWTRPVRSIFHYIQQAYKTAVVLPLLIFGLFILVRRKKYSALIILGIIPLYFFFVQSALHTEYRYILAICYISLAFSAVFLDWLITLFAGIISRRFGFRQLNNAEH